MQLFMPGDTKQKRHSRLSKDQIAEFLTKTELKKWDSINQKNIAQWMLSAW